MINISSRPKGGIGDSKGTLSLWRGFQRGSAPLVAFKGQRPFGSVQGAKPLWWGLRGKALWVKGGFHEQTAFPDPPGAEHGLPGDA